MQTSQGYVINKIRTSTCICNSSTYMHMYIPPYGSGCGDEASIYMYLPMGVGMGTRLA